VRGKYFPGKLSENDCFEICVGAILTQNTSWKNVESSLANLRKNKLISIDKMLKVDPKKLANLIKSSNYPNQKVKYLKNFAMHIKKNYNGRLSKFFSKNIPDLRRELLSIKGIGNETADSIILYAAEKPSFVVDAYTKRFAERFFKKEFKNYAQLKEFFERDFPKDAKKMNEMHALLVELGKRNCTKANPACNSCFLSGECLYIPK
jgi:endonuclease-3 related protein